MKSREADNDSLGLANSLDLSDSTTISDDNSVLAKLVFSIVDPSIVSFKTTPHPVQKLTDLLSWSHATSGKQHLIDLTL